LNGTDTDTLHMKLTELNREKEESEDRLILVTENYERMLAELHSKLDA
jgi:hypothetical protein